MVGINCLLIVGFPHFWTVIAAQALLGSTSAVIPPAIAALSLGLPPALGLAIAGVFAFG